MKERKEGRKERRKEGRKKGRKKGRKATVCYSFTVSFSFCKSHVISWSSLTTETRW
jgi:hypothetical protein